MIRHVIWNVKYEQRDPPGVFSVVTIDDGPPWIFGKTPWWSKLTPSPSPWHSVSALCRLIFIILGVYHPHHDMSNFEHHTPNMTPSLHSQLHPELEEVDTQYDSQTCHQMKHVASLSLRRRNSLGYQNHNCTLATDTNHIQEMTGPAEMTVADEALKGGNGGNVAYVPGPVVGGEGEYAECPICDVRGIYRLRLA